MRTRTQIRPLGGDASTDFVRQILDQVWQELQFYDSSTVKFQRTTRGITATAKIPPPGSSSGWQWANPIELVDPATGSLPGYNKGFVIHIQLANSICSVGVVDAANPTGPAVTSLPGFWVAKQDVPPQATVGGKTVWNLPHLPLPVPGNMDDPKNFWIPYWPDPACY